MAHVPVAMPVALNAALRLATEISRRISGFQVTAEAVEDASFAVYQRRVARGKALNAKNFEYVIERLLRPVVRDCTMSANIGLQPAPAGGVMNRRG